MSGERLADWIRSEAGDEPIEAVLLGPYGGYYPDKWKAITPGVLLSWAEAEPQLSPLFDAGYGSVGCPAVLAWTSSKVIFVSQYDGSTQIESVPRHPVVTTVGMPGG